jgi:hypothetical protein
MTKRAHVYSSTHHNPTVGSSTTNNNAISAATSSMSRKQLVRAMNGDNTATSDQLDQMTKASGAAAAAAKRAHDDFEFIKLEHFDLARSC